MYSGPSTPRLEASVQVAAKQMVGLYLSIWVRSGLLPNIGGVQTTSVGTGIMRYLGNKGVALLLIWSQCLCQWTTQAVLISCALDNVQGLCCLPC